MRDADPHEGRTDRWKQSAGAGFIVAVGLLLATFEAWHVFEMQTLLGKLLEAVLPLCLAVTLVYAGIWLARSGLDGDQILQIVAWFIAGTLGMSFVAGMVIGHQLLSGIRFHHVTFVLVNTVILGGAGGFVIGVYDVRSRQRQQKLQEQRQKVAVERERIAVLNRLLRHNVLNEMNLLLGHAGSLRANIDPEDVAALDAVMLSGGDIVNLIQKVRTLTNVIATEDASETPIDLSECLHQELTKIQRSFDSVIVTGEIPDDIVVLADDLLSEALKNVLLNSIQHNELDERHVSSTITTDAEKAIVTISDNGPGISDDVRASVTCSGDPILGQSDHGIGLTITRLLVDRYGGSILIDDSPTGGAEVRIELPRARVR